MNFLGAWVAWTDLQTAKRLREMRADGVAVQVYDRSEMTMDPRFLVVVNTGQGTGFIVRAENNNYDKAIKDAWLAWGEW